MASPPAIRGAIPPGGLAEALPAIEAERPSGRLVITPAPEGDADAAPMTLKLLGGQLVADGDDAETLDVALAVTAGTYRVERALPPLDGSEGDEGERSGALESLSVGELMRYCERGGVWASVLVEHDGRQGELLYERGTLSAIRVDGSDEGALGELFGWATGTFVIEAMRVGDIEELARTSVAPPAANARPRRDTTGKQLLRIVELSLASLEGLRDDATVAPPAPEGGDRAELTAGEDPDEPRGDATVKVLYLADAHEPDASLAPPAVPTEWGDVQIRADADADADANDSAASPRRDDQTERMSRPPTMDEAPYGRARLPRPGDVDGAGDAHGARATSRSSMLAEGGVPWVMILALAMIVTLGLLALWSRGIG